MENIGNKFREYRQKKNLSIEEVSEKTKIRKHIIQALEDGNLTVLPPVYLTYFIKTYAGFLKLPATDLNDFIALVPGADSKNNKPQAALTEIKPESQPRTITTEKNDIVKTVPEKKPGKSYLAKKKSTRFAQVNIVNYLIYAALGLAVFSLIYFAFFSNGTNNLASFSSDDGTTMQNDTALIGSETSNQSGSGQPAQSDSLVLEARGIDSAWIRIVIDGVRSEQILFYPEMEKRWSAKDYFMLSIGNEGAVEFKRNGQVLKPFGKKSTVIRNVKITGNDVIISSSPWNSNSDSTVKKAVRKIKKKEVKAEAPRLLEPSAIQNSFTPFEGKKPKIGR